MFAPFNIYCILLFSFLSGARENPAMTDWTHQSVRVFVVVKLPSVSFHVKGPSVLKKNINSKYDFFFHPQKISNSHRIPNLDGQHIKCKIPYPGFQQNMDIMLI